MTNTLLKRSAAIGSMVALASSALVSSPAFAADDVLITPTAGSTFNSIIGSAVQLSATVDPGVTQSNDNAYWVISNPGGKTLNIDVLTDVVTSGATDRYVVFNADGEASQVTGRTTVSGVTATGHSAAAGDFEYVVTASKIAIAAGFDADGNTAGSLDSLTNITIDTTATSTQNITVQLVIDNGTTDTATTQAIYNASQFDRQSQAQAITMYKAGSVGATSVLEAARGSDSLKAKITPAADVNVQFLGDSLGAIYYKDGTAIAVDLTVGAGGTVVGNASDGIVAPIVSGTGNRAYTAGKNEAVFTVGNAASANLTAGLYSARAVYTATSADTYLGSASAATDLSNGADSFVDGATASVERNANTQTDSTTNVNDVDLRTGTNSVTVAVQANSGSAKREAAGIKVRAIVEGVTITSGNDVTVTAAAGTIDARGDKITAFAFTDTKGVANFTINAVAGTKGDALTVDLAVLDSAGVYQAAGNGQITVDWENAALSTFTASPASYVSGDPVNITFTAKDQFGVGIDSTSTGALSVYAEAVVGGVVAPSTYNATVSTVDGVASFSFANFAAEGTPQQLKATLREGNANITDPAPVTVNVYDTYETASITVASSYTTDITYVDFVEGDTDVASVNAAVKAAGLDSATGATITGTVLDANNAGQPGAAVTVAADGVLFKNGTDYSEDSITFFANEFGSFTVNAYAHVQSSTGITVTVSTEGFSTTTLLKTYLPASLSDENLSFSVSLPETVVMNTTYAVVAKLTDKWGNPVAAKNATGTGIDGTDDAVIFQGAGSVEINSVGTQVGKDLGADGTATVFLRSIKDIAGPGSVSVSLGEGWTYAQGDGTTSTSVNIAATVTTDDTATAWDETTWSSTLSENIEVYETAADAPQSSSTQKVNAGSFKGYVAVYALGYEGQRLSAKIGNDWVIVDPIVNNESANLARVTDFTGAGYDIAVRIYIDRVLIDTINLTTK